MIKTRTFTLTMVEHKSIRDLADKIGGRIWSIDGLATDVVEPVSVVETTPAAPVLPERLAVEAQAFGALMSADSIEHGEAA